MENKTPFFVYVGIFLILLVLSVFLASIVFGEKADALAGVSVGDYMLSKTVPGEAKVLNEEIIWTQEMENKRLEALKHKTVIKDKPKEEKQQEKPKEVKIDNPTLGQKAGIGLTFSAQDNARLERLAICQEMYDKHKERITNDKETVIRCATMMTLQYAFESGHGKSSKCVNQNNCYGIKHNSRDRCIRSNNGFCTYSAQIEGSRDYAEMYMKHYEGYKSVTAYLNVYSPDGNRAYHNFVLSKYPSTIEWFRNNPAY